MKIYNKGNLLMSAAQYSMKEPEKDPHPARKHLNFSVSDSFCKLLFEKVTVKYDF